MQFLPFLDDAMFGCRRALIQLLSVHGRLKYYLWNMKTHDAEVMLLEPHSYSTHGDAITRLLDLDLNCHGWALSGAW